MKPPTHHLVEHFFRHESASLIAVLTRAFGIRRIDLVEDMVQVAMVEAMNAWKQRGVPDNPAAWIHRVAKNRLIDSMRREQSYEKAIGLSGLTTDLSTNSQSLTDQWLEEERLPDSLLRMIFVCCHPSLERKTQIALTLRTLCGFGISEIASGLLLPNETVKKRIQRAKKSLALANVRIEIPDRHALADRLNVVHDVLYLMFNEGYSATSGSNPTRDDICEEAARLCHLLCESEYATPATKALLALQLFHASRMAARTGEDGSVVLLEDQDRTQWDRNLIAVAQDWLARSQTENVTTFHLEAAIAMQHCLAESVDSTDWAMIVTFYTRLMQLRDSPLYVLNRAIAIGQTGDTPTALAELKSLETRPELKGYLLLDCAIARLYILEGENRMAIDRYLVALSKANAPHEKELLLKKLNELTERSV